MENRIGLYLIIYLLIYTFMLLIFNGFNIDIESILCSFFNINIALIIIYFLWSFIITSFMILYIIARIQDKHGKKCFIKRMENPKKYRCKFLIIGPLKIRIHQKVMA